MARKTSGYTQLRDGMADHAPKLTWQELATFYWMCNVQRRQDEPGWVPYGPRAIARSLGKPLSSVWRALRALEIASFIKSAKGGYQILNANGGQPQDHDWLKVESFRLGFHRKSESVPGGPHGKCSRGTTKRSPGTTKRSRGTTLDPLIDLQRNIDLKDQVNVDEETITRPGKGEAVQAKVPGGLQWDRDARNFVGPDKDGLKAKLSERYRAEFGERWLQLTWKAACEWCEDNPEKIRARKRHDRFLLTWYRTEAHRTRQRNS